MRLPLAVLSFALAACSSGDRGGDIAGPSPMDFEAPLLPSEGGPATPVRNRVPQHHESDYNPEARITRRPAFGNSSPSLSAPAFPLPPAAPAPAPAAEKKEERPPELTTAIEAKTTKGIKITTLAFDDRRCEILVADKAGGVNSEWQTAAVAGSAFNAIAAINGGFFTPKGTPLGIVVENGQTHGSWNGSSSLASGVLIVAGERSGLARRERWSPDRPSEFLLQSGPMLLEAGKAVAGLEDDSSRPRSFIAWDGGHHWAIGHARSATLAGLAEVLATQPVKGIQLRTVINLDGGTSSDLWISPQIRGGPVSTRQAWNKPVRNYVIIRKRSP